MIAAALIVGNLHDIHAKTIAEAVADRDCRCVVLDAATLSRQQWRWHNGSVTFVHQERWVAPARGWFRRLAPPDWHRDLTLGSLAGAESTARLALLTGLSDSDVLFLTPYAALAAAENKLLQYRTARSLSLPTPETAVVSNIVDVPTEFGDPLVVKPLGVGEYANEGVPHAVHTELLERVDPRLDGLAYAPFIVQRTIAAVLHLRVVTVLDQAWVAELDAAGLPLDWRTDNDAHHSWRTPETDREELLHDAVRLAMSLGLGYSSQDWIVDDNGTSWVVDVNPAGQWLFLPVTIRRAVTDAIADWLAGRTT